jgi:hypothetical protein
MLVSHDPERTLVCPVAAILLRIVTYKAEWTKDIATLKAAPLSNATPLLGYSPPASFACQRYGPSPVRLWALSRRAMRDGGDTWQGCHMAPVLREHGYLI